MVSNGGCRRAIYEIRIEGYLESRWAGWFDGMELVPLEDGSTTLRGPVIDQSALHGVLDKIRSLNLKLISVNRIDLPY